MLFFQRWEFTTYFGLILRRMKAFRLIVLIWSLGQFAPIHGQPTIGAKIATLEYGGGGDWYANPTALKNLARFASDQGNLPVLPNPGSVPVGSPALLSYDWVHLTGHGNIAFTTQEAQNLRTYLERGGFVHIDDNYGMDPYVRKAFKSVLPQTEWIQLSAEHPLFQGPFAFPKGLPKIHEHDGKAPEAWALYHGSRMVVLYTRECDLSDGWEDANVHNDPPGLRQQALKMGTNILHFVFRGQTPYLP